MSTLSNIWDTFNRIVDAYVFGFMWVVLMIPIVIGWILGKLCILASLLFLWVVFWELIYYPLIEPLLQ